MPQHHHHKLKSDRPRQVEKSQQRRQLQRKGKRRTMSITPDDPMEVDSGVTESIAPSNGHREAARENEDAADDFEFIHHGAGVDSVDSKQPPNDEAQPPPVPEKVSEVAATEVPETVAEHAPQTNETQPIDLEREFEKLRVEQAKQIEALHNKFKRLESENQRSSSTEERSRVNEGGELTMQEKERYEEKFRKFLEARAEMEQQIKELLDMQEATLKHSTEIEGQYRLALNHIEREKRAQEEAELNFRSDIATAQGLYRKEKERAQKLMRTMAEMQSADPYKLDNDSIRSSIKELRYSIRNWAFSQRLIPSPPQPGMMASLVHKTMSGRDRGPNYEFLSSISPNFHEYTESYQDFRYLLQAYVWKRIVEMVFNDNMWAGTRKALDDEEIEYRTILGHRSMKSFLEPEKNSNEEYISAFHEWRSTTARILDKRISVERRKRTVEKMRDDILKPLITAVSQPDEQEIRNVEDLESILEGAMRLATQIAQQRANFVFEIIPLSMYGKTEFQKGWMTDAFPAEQFNPSSHFRAVVLMLAPRLLKYGTSEGTNFEACSQLIEAEVETRILPRRYAMRRPIP